MYMKYYCIVSKNVKLLDWKNMSTKDNFERTKVAIVRGASEVRVTPGFHCSGRETFVSLFAELETSILFCCVVLDKVSL